MVAPNEDVERRKFLTAAMAGSVGGMTALAGCGGGGGTDTETDSDPGGGGSTEMGDQLPAYTYFNNPANYNAARHDAINLIGTQLNELGLDVSVEVLEWGTLYQRVRQEYDFDFCTWNHTHSIYPAQLMDEFFNSENTDPGQGNFTGWSSEQTDEVLATALRSTDVEERVDALHEFQTEVTEAAPTNAIVQMPSIVGYNNEQVSGWVDHLSGPGYFWNMTSIEVDNAENQLRGSWSETIGTLNPVGAPQQTKVNHQLDVLYDNLIRFDGDLAIDPEAGLASEWERPDTTTLRYTIKDHQWHDGEPVTAEDVAFSFNFIKEHQAPRYATQLSMYNEAEVVEEGTVQINLNEENAPGPAQMLLASQIPIIPQHIWSERDNPLNMQITAPVGSGPMVFDYWDEGSELSLVRNDDHFYPVSFDSRIWRIIPESSTTWELLLEGDLNYLPFSRIGRQLDQNRQESQVSVYQMPGNGWWHCSMNTRRDGLGDRAVRQSVVNALPKTPIVDQLLYGYPEVGFNLINESFGQYHNPDVSRYEESLDVARQRLRDEGYVFDEDGNVHFPAE